MNTLAVIACLIAVFAYGHATRQCYVCDGSDDSTSGKACKEKNPDVGDIARLIVPDDEKECLVCTKWIPDSGDVTRGCWSKDDFDDNYETFDFKKSERDACEKVNGVGELCICEGNKCNGARGLGISLALLALFAAAKLLL